MTPEEYEQQVAEYFTELGYDVKLSSYTNDYGVDVFASKGKERIAIQAKMYGSGIRPINRQMVMELCGAMHYFDCTSAKFVTDGRILDDAKQVADKLHIEIISLIPNNNFKSSKLDDNSFSNIWEQYVVPLEGKTIKKENGKTNKIVSVDWSGIKRITSNGKIGTIKIEIFKLVINHLKEHKEITRKAINEEYLGRASSGICLILSQLPFIDYVKTRPSKLVWKK
jgi:restriction system protein